MKRNRANRAASRTLASCAILLLFFAAVFAAPQAFAAVTFRAAASASVASGALSATTGGFAERTDCGDINPSIPSGSVGDLLVAQVIARDNGAAVSMPGWSTLYSDNVAGDDYQVFLFHRSATNTDDDTNTISQSGACDHLMGRITRFGNVDTAQPLEPTAGNAVFSDAGDVDTGTQQVNVAGSMLLMATFVANDRTVAQPGSFTELYDDADNSARDAGISLNYRVEATAGMKGPFTNMDLAGGGNDLNHGVLFAVRPAAAQALTINVPAGTVAGEVLVASVSTRPSAIAIATPSGWTLIRDVVQGGGNSIRLATYYRVADGTEPASYAWTLSGGTHVGAAGGIASFSGADTVLPIDAEAGQATPVSLDHTAPDVTTTAAGGMLVTIHAFSSAASWTPPAGMTEVVDAASLPTPDAAGLAIEMNYQARPTPGATGTRTATAASDADVGATQSVALRAGPLTCSTTLVSGIRGNYFANMTLAGAAAGSRVDGPVDFDWGTGSPGVTGIGSDQFSVRWDGILRIMVSGDYQFQTVSDDGVRLWVNDQLIIDNWTDGATTDTSGNVTLVAGQIYAIQLEYYENAGSSVIRLHWRPPGDAAFTPIPAGPEPALDAGLYYCSAPPAAALLYYAMDEASWNGTAGEVVDASGNGNHGVRVGAANTVAAGRVCRAGDIPDNASAVDTGRDVNSDIGGSGTIAFWYNSDEDWNVNNRMLFDASNDLGNNNADKYFFLVKENTGRLRFRLEDSGDTDSEARTGVLGFTAGTWVHIAVTWDLPNDLLEIYVDGSLAATSTANVNGTLGDTNTLYLGDNRTGGVGGGGYTTNSANGALDEVYIFGGVLSQSQIAALRDAAHGCVAVDHFALSHGGTAVTCQAEPVTVSAHDTSHAVVTAYTGTITLATATGAGDWSLVTGAGTLVNGTVNDGQAAYTFDAADAGQVTLALKHTASGAVNINIADGATVEDAAEDPPLTFRDSGFRFIDAGNAENILAQTAGQASATYYLQAIRTDTQTGACVGVFGAGQTVNIGLASQCNDPTTCNGRQVTFSNNGIDTLLANNPDAAVASYTTTPVTFLGDSTSRALFTFTYPDVGRISLHARYNIPLEDGSPSATNMVGSSNLFVVRPAGFVLSNIVRTSDGFVNPAASDATGVRFIGAGQAFTVTVTAVTVDGSTPAPNFGREATPEGVLLSSTLVAPATGVPGTLANAAVAGAEFGAGGAQNDPAGSATVTNLSWSEVGIMQLTGQVADNDYLGAGPAPNSYPSANIGRFTPDHFALGNGTLVNRIDESCSPASAFTYMGEMLRLGFRLTAQSASNTTTENYVGTFAKLDPNDVTVFNIGAIDTVAPTPLTSRVAAVSSSGSWSNGVADNVFARVGLNRAVTVDGRFQAVKFGIAPVDPDGVALTGFDLDVDNDAANDHALIAAGDIRFGRLVLLNAFGSELVDLPMPMRVQYYVNDNTGFVTNSDDNCTAATLTLSNHQGNLAATDTCVLDTGSPGLSGQGCSAAAPATKQYKAPAASGDFNLHLRAPGAGNDGSVDISADLSPTGLNMPWLQYDWDGDGVHDNDPKGRATFGIYKGNPRHIYRREQF